MLGYNLAIWIERNGQLYKIERIQTLEGKHELVEPIKAEYKIGFNRLPAYGFTKILQQKRGTYERINGHNKELSENYKTGLHLTQLSKEFNVRLIYYFQTIKL